MRERGPRPIEPLSSADALSATADITVSKRFRNLIPEKAKQAAKIVKKSVARVALTAPVLSLIISTGCGNTETQPQSAPEPTPISSPTLSPALTETPTPKLIPRPTETPTPKPTETPSTPTPEPTPILIPTAIPTRTPTATPTRTTESTPTRAPTLTPTATSIRTPEPAPTNTPRPPTPTRVPEATPTPTPEASAKSINFVFGEGVTLEQQKEIKDGIFMVKEWFSKKVDIKLDDVSVFAFANSTQLVDLYLQRTIYPRPRDEVQKQLSGTTAFTGEKKDMFINTSSPGWTNSSPIIGGPIAEGRKHTLAHEFLHIFQREVGGYNGAFPHWLNEGGAHYAAARALVDDNVYSYEKIRDGHLKEAGNMRENLKSMESPQGFYGAGSPYADEYSLGFLATEYLVKNLPSEGMPAIASFWQEIGKGNPWQTAFQSSFGKTLDQFYSEFEKYRQQGFR